jgi:hypothetical protein
MKKIYLSIFTLLFTAALFAQPVLRVNEIMSLNSSTIADPDFGLFADWIEIYNPNATSVDLAGLYISDDPANLTKYQFPTGEPETIIPAGGFILIWCDDSASVLHTNFKLTSAGESAILTASDGSTVIDSITFPAITADQSYGRTIDGAGTWTIFTPGTTTPGASNQPTQSIAKQLNDLGILVFPTPATDIITIQNSQLAKIEQITVRDMKGSIVYDYQSQNGFNQDILNFNVSDWKNGVYLLQVKVNNDYYSQRIIKK